MALDLGNLLGNVIQGITQYQTTKLGMQVSDSPFIPNFIETPIDNFLSGASTVPVQTVSGVNMACGPQPKRVLGYLDQAGNFCKKKSRKRRSRLATRSDIKDLSALKGVLGQGKAFEVWIATHG